MDKYIGTIARVTDPAARRMLLMLCQENQELKEELERLKNRKGPPMELEVLKAKSRPPDIA